MTKKKAESLDVSVTWPTDRKVMLWDQDGNKLVSLAADTDDKSVILTQAFRRLAYDRDEAFDVGGVRIDPDGNLTISVPVATLVSGSSAVTVKKE